MEQQELIEAVICGNVSLVSDLLEIATCKEENFLYSLVNTKDPISQYSLLHIAACNDYYDIIRILVQNGALLEERDGHEKTALHLAICSGSRKAIQELIELGANINSIAHGYSCLHLAATFYYEGVITYLIQNGCSLQSKTTTTGRTALHVAVYYGNLESAKELLQNGANIYETDNKGNSTIDIANKSKTTMMNLVNEYTIPDIKEPECS
jgi:ankyrin repeat protein